MKKNKKINKKVPTYAFGLAGAIGAGSFASNLTEGLMGNQTNQFGKPSGAKVGVNTATGALSGAAAGLTIGGPIGAGIGALAGGITSLFRGKKQQREALEAERKYNNQAVMQTGYENTALLQQQYNEENDLAYTFADGGIIGNDLAYLDNEEIIRTINGDIEQVPNTTVGTDQHLVDASGLESVLSDKIKRPGTKNTFAQEGEKIMKAMKPSKGKDRFAENTNYLNKINANNAYDTLLNEQEQVKAKKGIKNKSKAIPKYAYGVEDLYTSIPNINVLAQAPVQSLYGVTANNVALQNMPTTFDFSTVDLTKGSDLWDTKATSVAGNSLNLNLPNLNNVGNDLLGLTNTLYNWRQGNNSPEIEDARRNPYTGAVTQSLSRRRFNTRPVTEANRRTRSIANYNASNVNPNTGANLALRNQMAVSEYAANADLQATRQNINNQYLGEYANVLNNLGQQYNASAERASDINAANRARQRSYTAQAASDISKWSQNRQLMTNQANRDQMVWPLLSNYLSQGYDSETIQQLNNRFYGNR